MGWFFGFKLHFTCNTHGELTNLMVTNGNVDDRAPVIQLVKGFRGKMFGDKGYVGKELCSKLAKLGITFIDLN